MTLICPPKGGVISPLLSNVYLHWFETCAAWVAKQTNQDMSIVRYADDFVILAGKLRDGFVRRIEHELEHRFDLVVNREKTKVLDMNAPKAALAFLGYEFRKVRDRHYCKGDTYLEYGPSNKSVKKVCAKVKVLPMTTVSHGKPYAGNPHVRLEEGDSASAEPRRKSLLHTCRQGNAVRIW